MAVDIWSLGLIALLLAAPKHDIPDELNRMSQSDLDRCLTENFRNYCPQPSINAKCFIWGCLQVSPSDRINTTKAECHDWLRTPEKHLEFFRRLDQRMMADWSPKRHLKPMPWELQSLKDALEQPNYSCEDGDQGNGEDDESGLLEADLDDDSSLTSTCFLKPDPGDDEISLVSIPAEFNPPPTWEEATTPLQVQNASKKALSTSQKPRLVSSSDSKAIHQKSQKKRKRKPSKILDSLFLPLTGLERHLRPASTGVKREEILEELKKTNSKFLKEGSSSKRGVPTRETLHPHVEPNTKRQRNKCSS